MPFQPKIHLFGLLLTSIVLFANCAKEQIIEGNENQDRVITTEASSVHFYDNYDNDSDSASWVATLDFEAGATTADMMVNMHVFADQLLNNEFYDKYYALPAYVGTNTNNSYFYFSAKEIEKEGLIGKMPKDFTVKFQAKDIPSVEGFPHAELGLFRIPIPRDNDWKYKITKTYNTFGALKEYDPLELNFLISGKYIKDSEEKDLGLGSTNLFNWEKVEGVTLDPDGKNATVSFTTNDFDYIYCFAFHELPFEIIREITLLQQGIAIASGENWTGRFEPKDATSTTEHFYYATVYSEPIQTYYFLTQKSSKKEDSPKYIHFAVSEGGTNMEKFRAVIQSLDKERLIESVFKIKVKNDESFEANTNGLKYTFDNEGVLLDYDFQLPDEANTFLQDNIDFWKDPITSTKAYHKVDDDDYYVVTLDSGTEFHFNLVDNKIIHIKKFASTWDLGMYVGGFPSVSFTEGNLFPYAKKDNSVGYMVRFEKTRGWYWVDETGQNKLLNFYENSYSSSFPLAVVNYVQEHYNSGIAEQHGAIEVFNDVHEVSLQVELQDGKILIFKFDESEYKYTFHKEMSNFTVLPTAIANKFAADYAGADAILSYYFFYRGEYATRLLVSNSNTTFLTMAVADGRLLEESIRLKESEIPEATLNFMLENLPFYKDGDMGHFLKHQNYKLDGSLSFTHYTTNVYVRPENSVGEGEDVDITFDADWNYVKGFPKF